MKPIKLMSETNNNTCLEDIYVQFIVAAISSTYLLQHNLIQLTWKTIRFIYEFYQQLQFSYEKHKYTQTVDMTIHSIHTTKTTCKIYQHYKNYFEAKIISYLTNYMWLD